MGVADGRGGGRLKVVAAAGVGAAVAAGAVGLAVRSAQPPAAAISAVAPDLFDEPPVVCPPVSPAGEAALAEDAEVIGVSAGGRHRAYPVGNFRPTFWHVVNDLVGGAPVTVTHCPRDGCTRVLGGPGAGRPLGLTVAGYAGGLVVRDGGVRYRQADGAPVAGAGLGLPYPDVPFVRTTWRAWRAAHPDTDLSLAGDRPDPRRGTGRGSGDTAGR